MWWRNRERYEAELREAQAAKIQAGIDHAQAQVVKREAVKKAEQLRHINRENHFSEGLSRAMRKGGAV